MAKKEDMYMRIKKWIVAITFVAVLGGIAGAAVPVTAGAKSAADCAKPILTFPVWYQHLYMNDDCTIQGPGPGSPLTLSSFIWIIVMNIIDILLQLVGYLSIFFIIYGGFQYLTSSGSAEGTVKGRKTITNAVIGLVISIVSVAIVQFIAGAIS